MKKMLRKAANAISGYKKKMISIVKKPKFEGLLRNSKNKIGLTTIHFSDPKGCVRAVMDIDREELYIVPPGEPKKTHELYSQVCDMMETEYIDSSTDFPIAVPMSFYIKMAQQCDAHDRYKEAMEFREKALKNWVKWKEENNHVA